MGPCGEYLDGLLDGFAQAEFHPLELELARLDLGEIQDVVDDLQQRFGRTSDRFRKMPLARSELGRLQQFRHSHDAVHRRANFVAHARQKLALGAAGPLRRLLGAIGLADGELEVEVGVAQIDRAFFDLLLEKLAVLLQPRVAISNLPEHLVEAVDERADFILRVAFDTQAVVFLGRYPLHGVRQVDYGPGDLVLQPRGEPVRGQHGGHDCRQRDEDVAGPIRIHHLDRHEYVDESRDLILAHDGRDDVESAALHIEP